MYPAKLPSFITRFSGEHISFKINTSEKKLFITFDDGPAVGITEDILKILDEYKAKATFFCVGNNVAKHPEIYNSILEKGHATGNHTYNHLNGWETSSENYYKNIEDCQELVHSDLFRPPYGKIKPSQLLNLRKKHHIIFWSLLSGDFDFENTPPEKCLQNVINNYEAGSIVVFHDNIKASKNVLYALPRFLAHAQENGYTFETISPAILSEQA